MEVKILPSYDDNHGQTDDQKLQLLSLLRPCKQH